MAAIEEVSPGDVLFVGTNHRGLGAMQDGDTIEIGVGGGFSSTVGDPLKRCWPKGVDEATAKDVREGAGGPGRQARPCRPYRVTSAPPCVGLVSRGRAPVAPRVSAPPSLCFVSA